ncbi:hypothetical protein SODG_001515 [Sodalis praecaptivus]
MPWQPLKRCTEPGCFKRVKSGKCELHKQAARRLQDKRRGTHTQRGYSSQWAKYRLSYLKEHPLCVACESNGIYKPAKIVDHIIPVDGGSDVLFWWKDNHQALCMSCHSRKTMTKDPQTKAQRKAGMFREQEEKAAHRWDWLYEIDI